MKKNYIKYFMFLFISFFTFMITSFASNEIFFELQKSTDKINLVDEYGWNELQSFKLEKFDVDEYGNEYITVEGCTLGDLSSCVIKPNVSNFSVVNQSKISIKYSYVDSNGQTKSESFVISITIGRGYIARLLMIDGTEINYNGWSASSGTLSNNRTYEFYVADSESTTLPTPSNSVLSGKSYENLVEFKGYEVYDVATAASGTVNIHAVGTCNVGANPGDTVQDGKVYSSCYEYKNYLQLSTDGYGALASVGGTKLTKTDNYFVDGSTKWYFEYSGKYFTTSTDSGVKVKLPDLNFDGAFNAGRKLECWLKQGTSDCVNAGTEVELDGSVYVANIVYERTSYNTYRSVRVGQTSTLTISDGTITSCALEDSSNTNVSVEFSDGKCKVKGLAVTDYDEYIPVIVKYDSGSSERTFFFSVDNNVTSFTVADEDTKLTEKLYVDESGFQSNVCSDYKVSAGGRSEAWGTYGGKNLTSTIYNVESKCGDTTSYVAFCLDPGRAGPSVAGLDYYLTAMLDKDSELGKLAYYVSNHYKTDINSSFDISTAMKDKDSSDRIAIHIAFRIVAIGSGYGASADSSHELYATLYQAYEVMAEKLYKKDTDGKYIYMYQDKNESEVKDVVNAALDSTGVTWLNSEVREKVGKILSKFHNVDVVNVDDFERVITSTKVDASADNKGYTITYKGTITAPKEAGKLTLTKPTGISGITFEGGFVGDKVEKDNKQIYEYEIKVIVADAVAITEVPTTRESQIKYSFKVTYENGTGVGNIFIASPASAGTYQRMTIFNLEDTSLYLYFDIAPSTCESIDALDYANHCGKDSCDSSFNEDLFKLSSCCKYVTNEEAYPYIIHSVCNSSCTTSTMSSVCSYNASNVGSAELYEIKEGSKYNGTGYDNDIGGGSKACVVNVTEYTSSSKKEDFTMKDEAGNEISSKAFSNNQYCKVSCKEDWQISMSSFGNYVGVNAVAAGSYFQIQNKDETNNIFIGQTVTCYTSYINVNKFLQDVVSLSNQIVSAYNEYSYYSHVYSDMANWPSYDDDKTEITVGGTEDANSYAGKIYNDNNTEHKVEACNEYYQKYTCSSGVKYGDWTDCDDNNYCSSEFDKTKKCKVVTPNYYCPSYTKSTIGNGASLKCIVSSMYDSSGKKVTKKVDSNECLNTIYNGTLAYRCNALYSSDINYVDATPVDDYTCKTKVYAHAVSISVGKDTVNAYGEYKDDDKSGTSANDGNYASIGANNVSSITVTSGSVSSGSQNNNISNRGDVSDTKYVYTEFDLSKDFCTVTPSNDGKPDKVEGNCYVNGTKTTTLDEWIKEDNLSTLSAKTTGEELFKKYIKNGEAKGDYLKKLDDDTKTKATNLYNLNSDVVTKIDDMFACQHFVLYNASTDESVASTTLKGLYSESGSKEFTMINSLFNPGASYDYDELAFNKILQSNNDNYIEQFTELNDKYYGGEGKYNSSNNTSIKLDGIKSATDATTEAYLSRNDLKSTYYIESSSWKTDSTNAKDYNGSVALGKDVIEWAGDSGLNNSDYNSSKIVLCGGLGSEDRTTDKTTLSNLAKAGSFQSFMSYINTYDGQWYGGACFVVDVKFLDISYLKTSISNSSFYKNKGYWYVDSEDHKEHGDNFTKALENANAKRNAAYNINKEKNSGRWSKYGMYNVFPVSLTTPRNLYTYTYTFFDIGTYFNADASYGRIMGASSALIANNSRTCFYEVFEEVCLCCGDATIGSLVSGGDSNKIIDAFLDAAGNLNKDGYSYKMSDSAKMDSNNNASLGFMSSSVSLSDLTAGTGNSASNWSDSSEFLYADAALITNKGEVASNSIQGAGETIYSSTDNAEYSYVLTPATLSTIRNYNDAHGYEINYDNLTVYGRYSIASLTGDTNESSWVTSNSDDMNEIINFQHYGSKFLEEFMYNDVSNAVVKSLATRGNGNVCYLVEDGSSDRSDEIKNLMNSGCRWIDYIENIENNTSGATEYKYVFAAGDAYPETTKYFRLAFK